MKRISENIEFDHYWLSYFQPQYYLRFFNVVLICV